MAKWTWYAPNIISVWSNWKKRAKVKNDPVMLPSKFMASHTTLILELATSGSETEYNCKNRMSRLLTFDPWLSLTPRHRSVGYRMKPRAKGGKILHLQPLGVYKNMPRNQGQTLGHLSQIIFPDSRQKILKFPDFPEGQKFPWWWQPCMLRMNLWFVIPQLLYSF